MYAVYIRIYLSLTENHTFADSFLSITDNYLTFESESTSKAVEFMIFNDSNVEAMENVSLTLEVISPTSDVVVGTGKEGLYGSVTVLILDDDGDSKSIMVVHKHLILVDPTYLNCTIVGLSLQEDVFIIRVNTARSISNQCSCTAVSISAKHYAIDVHT